MFNTAKRVIAIVLSLVLVFALAGCSKVTDDGSSYEIEYITEEVYVDGDSTTDGDNTQNNNQSTGSNVTSGTSKPTDTTENSDSPILANPADYKGTKIIFATTIDPKDDGTDYVVSKFEKEYGIEVEIMVPTLTDYNAEMSNLIASGKAPTVGRSNGDAPIYVGYFQSLDAAKVNYKHELWNQNTFKRSTYNGSPYLLDTMGNFWTELDMVVYSKSLLKKANCPTPEDLDKAGNWNFDTFLMIGQKTAAAVENCNGASYHVPDCILHMAGAAVYRVDDKNYLVNGIDAQTTSIIQKIAQGHKDKYIVSRGNGGGPEGLINGTVAITTTYTWALRTDGYLKDHKNYNDLGFYYLPAFEKGGERPVTGLFRGWGIMKGCNENPATGSKAAVAGGLFLSEYLNVNNYDLDKSFLTEEAKTFYFKMCALYAETNNYNPYYTYTDLNEGISGVDDDAAVYNMFYTDPAQVPTMMAAVKSSVQKGVENLNKYIDQQMNSH